ncbi:BV-E31 [Erinnyis ello granulovirus]|uniref:BV-E31 n=1 Tax=Erinnyis ello granulovirus TaxID=307444 RepID=A0A097DAL3_9BBAC|nr:BV-E31 [Erinnyis ello granulovirus]AIS92061.1 BV-E31 [Erinnyis ello granulovirus]ARX71401.1 bv-e31 [Erinnyis ello granulovirus]ARX71531.1 bv-e31 [Erinnyis ello granulovirus]ARX71661.1 bv-e31 [Erinnyis ello granulovirus]ARX71791.1 bv-e31 [Erinnyis ello granulovirus]
MVKHSKHAGLFVLTEDDRAIILQANKSYNECVNKNLKYNKHIPFVEKLSIPRGKHDSGEKNHETALREFIEETGLVFDKVYMCTEPFTLEWQDNNKVYKYTIFVAFLIGSLYNLNRRPNTYNIKLKETSCVDVVLGYKVDVFKQKFRSQELVRKIEIMNLHKYIAYMSNRQLATYKYSNYYNFFEYVYTVKRLYKMGCMECFVSIDLSWLIDCEKYNILYY